MATFGLFLAVFAFCPRPGDPRFINEPVSMEPSASGAWTSDICSDCSRIIETFTDMIANEDTQEVIYTTLGQLCRRLPNEEITSCLTQLKAYLTQVLQYISGHLKPGEACMVLGLCAFHSERDVVQLPEVVADTDVFSRASNEGTGTRVQISPQCTLCLFVIKKLEDMLPKNRTEEAIVKLMGQVCGLIPHRYKDQCDDFIIKYGKQIVDFLLSSAAPHSICALLHLCLFEGRSSTELLLPCDSCRTVAALSRLHLGLNSTEPQTSSFLQSVCLQYPNVIPKCEVFATLFGSRLQKVLGNQMEAPDACESASLCVAAKEVQTPEDFCTRGPNYWCRDMGTAQKCGRVAFCERFMWI